MHNKFLPALIIAMAVPLQAPALTLQPQPNTFDYDYLDAGLVDYDAGGSGLYIDGSHDVYPNFNLIGSFVAADHYTEISAGLGYHMAIPELENSDVNFFAGIERGEFDVGGGSIDDSETGGFIGTGIRASATPSLELFSTISYHSFYSGDLALDLGLRLQLNEQLDFTRSGQLSDNDALAVGVRYYY